MRKLLIIISLVFACALMFGLSACAVFEDNSSNTKLYNVDNKYFSQTSFEKHTLTSIGVNGHQGSGTSYEVQISSKCQVSLVKYSASVKLYAADNTLLDSFVKSFERKLSAKSEISFTNSITYETFQELDNVVVTWTGQSYDNPNKVDNTPLIPIESISLSNQNTTMLIGESITLNYTISPTNTDDKVIVSCGDPTIVELDGNKVTAKNIGNTWISIKASSHKSSAYAKEISIKVIPSLNYTNFKTLYGSNLEKATVSVFCKRYNKNWLGQEKNTYTVSGKGTIVKSVAYANYFLTDKTIFDTVSTQYEYEEWYITDYLGKKYSIAGLQFHKTAQIGLGSFTSSTAYSIATVNNAYAYEGDYAISLFGNPLTCRINETGYFALTSSTIKSNVFYHESGLNSKYRGEAIYNINGEIIGISLMFSANQVTSVSAIEIRELLNAVFNTNSSGGGPIDIA